MIHFHYHIDLNAEINLGIEIEGTQLISAKEYSHTNLPDLNIGVEDKLAFDLNIVPDSLETSSQTYIHLI